MRKNLQILLFFINVLLIAGDPVMLCYYKSNSFGRPDQGKFEIEDIDPTVCTHVVWTFASLSNVTWEIEVDPNLAYCDNGGRCGFERFNSLKETNPDLKTMISVGGGASRSADFSQMSGSATKRNVFINSTMNLLKHNNFNGLDVDWEYPGKAGGVPEDRENFVTLLSELKTALHSEAMILTTAVGNGAWLDSSYDHVGIDENVDYINLMTYHYHYYSNGYIHYNTPLYAHPQDQEHGNQKLNVDWSVQHWLAKGFSAQKLLLGMALYGSTFSLADPSSTDIYAPASGPGAGGPITRWPGSWIYNEICTSQQSEDWTVVNDPSMHEPYAYYLPRDNLWISYDDPDSLKIKAEYARINGLAGAMVWTLDDDDFRGLCHGRTFHLIRTITENLVM